MLRRALVALALPLVLLLAAAWPAAARSLTIQRFDVELEVRPDATLEVTERIEVRFTGSWQGLYRTIPVEYRTPQGFDYALLLDIDSVTDGDFAALKYETSRERHYRKIKIYVPGAQDAVRTVILTYKVYDGLRFFEDHDELYWNVTGDEWTVPIEAATAHVRLPAGVTGLRTTAFTGAYGSREQFAEMSIQGNEVRFAMSRPLSFHEGLTTVVGWDKGLVREPTTTARVWLFLRSNWPLAIPVVVFLIVFVYWYAYGRDPRLRPISPQYAPSGGLTPGEAGTLVDSSADMRDVTATIVDLAVRGYIRIEETQQEQMLGLWHSKDYAFHLLKPVSEWKDLRGHERKLLDAMFGGSTEVKLHELENKFYKSLPDIRDQIFEELQARRYFKVRPDTFRTELHVVAGAVGAAVYFLGKIVGSQLGMQITPFVIAAVLSALIIFGLNWVMHERTVEGTRVLEGTLGFEEFLKRVETDHFERVTKTPEMFEKFLPFAMAFGVEKHWCKAFDGIYRQPPQWYQGTGYGPTFQPSLFLNNLNGMTARTSSVLASAPRSSGGSGFGGGGGGGFSGGGFGGGGGGGF